ncbi:MAG TPA: GNAT family N-acetyltransferase [Blastocatellia bacterium]|jgi:GNAT superfamily N-acetyltransferase
MNENTSHTLRGPENEDEWRVYHAIRRKVLFENRGRFGVYNENHPDEFEKDNHPLILFDRDTPIGVIRVDVRDRVAWFRRVAVREDLQRAGHGRALLSLAEAFAREAGCNEARSDVAADAVGFYERCGYSRDLSTPAESGSVLMQKPLT